MQNQHAALKKFCKQQAIEVDEWVLEIGGGLNFERTQFLRLVDRIVSGEVERVVLAHQDRLVRCGYKLLAHLCQAHQTALVVMNTETLSPEQELVQDLMAILEEEGGQDLIQQVRGLLCQNIQQTFPFPQ